MCMHTMSCQLRQMHKEDWDDSNSVSKLKIRPLLRKLQATDFCESQDKAVQINTYSVNIHV